MLEGGGEPIASIPASYQTVHTHRGHVDCTATTRRAHRGRRTARALRPQLTALACTTTGPAPGMQIPVPDRSSEPLPATQRASLVHLRCGTNRSPMPIIDAASPRDRYRPPRAEPKLWGAAQTYWSRSPTQENIHAAPGTHRSSTNSPSARRREVLGDDVMLGVRSTPY